MSAPNIANITAWVEALESGDYAQCKGQLRKDIYAGPNETRTAHCCLGVATDLYLKAHGEDWSDSGNLAKNPAIAIYPDDGSLSYRVMDWLGISQDDPVLHEPSRSDTTATTMNDSEGVSFEGIAAAIRYTYLNKRQEPCP